MLTTYIVKGLKKGFVWEFNYNLNGSLRAFKITEGQLTVNQMKWLFSDCNFPASELLMNTIWIKNPELKGLIEVIKAEVDLTFDAFWNLYDNKVGKRKMAEGLWKRLSKADKILIFINIPKYKNYLKHYPTQQMMYPTTYLNQEAYKNDWKI